MFKRVAPSISLIPTQGTLDFVLKEVGSQGKSNDCKNSGEEIPTFVFHTHGDAEDIAVVCAIGLDIENYNDLALENIPKSMGTSIMPFWRCL